MKRVFGKVEIIFDVLYLVIALIIGIFLILSSTGNSIRLLAGIMALTLSIGDAFHLVPRILSIITNNIELFRYSLGRGKQITSITMTVFYILLWQIGVSIYTLNNIEFITYIIYFLSFIRIILCLLPQNRWIDRYPPVVWGIWRNIPFFILGILVAAIFFMNRLNSTNFGFAWLAILLSFLFYLPVVLWSNKNPKIGMLMLPKTLMYLWILIMCLSI